MVICGEEEEEEVGWGAVKGESWVLRERWIGYRKVNEGKECGGCGKVRLRWNHCKEPYSCRKKQAA